MTGEEIRDIGFLRWRDPFAWLERMKGGNWTSLLEKENTMFDTAVKMIASKEHISEMKKVFQRAKDAHVLNDTFQCGDVMISVMGKQNLEWHWVSERTEKRSANEVFSKGDLCWSIEEDADGKEIYTVSCYKKGKKEPIWSRKESVGPFLAVRNNICYVVEATGELQYRKLVCFNAETGKEKKTLFEEKSLRNNLSLIQKENGCVFLISENSGRQRLFHVNGFKVEPLCPQGVAFFPVGYGPKGDICFFARENSFSSPWKAFGHPLKLWSIPKELRMYRIQNVSLKHKLLSILVAGKTSFYECRSGVQPSLVHEFIGSLHFDPHAIQEARDTIPCIYSQVGCYPIAIQLPTFSPQKLKLYADCSTYEAKSKDGTKIPFVLVKQNEKKKSKGVLCIAYGAYNIPTALSLSRWKPYLDSDWCICFAMVRGGGDFGDQWAEDARRDKKYKSIEDVESVIKAAQQIEGLSSAQTCLYGRSAGGYIVGTVCAHHGKGNLIGAAYAEVPYVDILRTTTNPKLPLTILEYDEFGNPAERLEDLQTILRLSPVDALSPEGAPGIFVVATTSTNDREVLPYESVKWILKLRGFPEKVPGQMKLLRILHKQGHFVKGVDEIQQKTEDYILLQTYLETLKK